MQVEDVHLNIVVPDKGRPAADGHFSHLDPWGLIGKQIHRFARLAGSWREGMGEAHLGETEWGYPVYTNKEGRWG